MNIYLLKRKKGFEAGFDNYRAHIVQAKTPQRARQLCPDNDTLRFGKEIVGKSVWLDSKKTSIRKIGVNNSKREKVILSDFNAG